MYRRVLAYIRLLLISSCHPNSKFGVLDLNTMEEEEEKENEEEEGEEEKELLPFYLPTC